MKPIISTLTFYIGIGLFQVASLPGQNADSRVDREVRRDIINRVSRLLESNYVDSIKGKEAGGYLKERFIQSAYQTYDHPRALAEALTADLQNFLDDKHLRLRELSLAEQQSRNQNPLFTIMYDSYIKYTRNYGVRKVEILSGNIGYLVLDSFEPLQQVRHKLIQAMSFLADVNGLIIDLRENNGGNPETVQFLCSFFFESSTHLNNQYWRRGNYIEEFWTFENTGNKKQNSIPLFVLTSHRTFSAAEEFTYNLKTQKRALIIGERTAGGANPGYSFPVGTRFVIFIPTGRPVNPVTGTNWEGTGVEPDIKISADRALDTALGKATIDAQRFAENQDKFVIREFLALTEKLNQADNMSPDSRRIIIRSVLDSSYKKKIVDESLINSLGYYYLNKKRMNSALAVFLFNVDSFPHSSNVYDSLGEAYYKSGDRKKAVYNYKKSLEINPQNQNARLMLKILSNNYD